MVDVPPGYTNSFVCLYTWPAASTLNMAVDSGIPFARKRMISVVVSNTMRPNAAHTTVITTRIFFSCSGARRPRHRQHKACPKAASPGLTLRQFLLPVPRPPFPPHFYHQSVHDAFVCLETRGGGGHVYNRPNKMLNRRGASTHL